MIVVLTKQLRTNDEADMEKRKIEKHDTAS